MHTLAALLVAVALAPFSREDPRPSPSPAPAAKAVAERIPGTRVTLAAPADGREPGEGFLGYQWPERGASLIVIEMPAPFAEVAKAWTPEGAARGGMELLDVSDATVAGRAGKLVHVRQKVGEAVFLKWIAVCGEGERTLMLNAVFPEVLADELSAPLKAALLGAEWDTKLEIDPFAVLPWTFSKPEGLRFAANLGTTLLFTEDGEVVQKEKPGSARLMVGPSMGKVEIGDPRRYAERRARGLPLIGPTLEIESSTAFEAGGRKGWEIVGKARDEKHDLELAVHHVMLFGDDGYVAVTSQCAYATRETWLPRWRACASSWREKPRPAADGKR